MGYVHLEGIGVKLVDTGICKIGALKPFQYVFIKVDEYKYKNLSSSSSFFPFSLCSEFHLLV